MLILKPQLEEFFKSLEDHMEHSCDLDRSDMLELETAMIKGKTMTRAQC